MPGNAADLQARLARLEDRWRKVGVGAAIAVSSLLVLAIVVTLVVLLLRTPEAEGLALWAALSAAATLLMAAATAWLGYSTSRSAKALAEDVALHRDELRYYYQPGLAAHVHEPVRPGGQSSAPTALFVKVYPISQPALYRAVVAWECGGHPLRDMREGPESCAPQIRPRLEPPASSWTCGRIRPNDTWWCLLDARPPGTHLVVRWEHTAAGYAWSQEWELTHGAGVRGEADSWGLRPLGPPHRQPIWGDQ